MNQLKRKSMVSRPESAREDRQARATEARLENSSGVAKMFAPHHQASTGSSCTQDPCKGNPHTFPASRELSKKDLSLLTDIFMKSTPGEPQWLIFYEWRNSY